MAHWTETKPIRSRLFNRRLHRSPELAVIAFTSSHPETPILLVQLYPNCKPIFSPFLPIQIRVRKSLQLLPKSTTSIKFHPFMTMKGHDRINNALPDELILEIFRRLDSQSSRDACSLVCRRWFHLERISRETIRIGASTSPDQLVKALAARFPNVRNVYIDERLTISLPAPLVSPLSFISFVLRLI